MHTKDNSTLFDLTSTVHEMSSIDPPGYNPCLQDDSSEMLQTILHSIESDTLVRHLPRVSDFRC